MNASHAGEQSSAAIENGARCMSSGTVECTLPAGAPWNDARRRTGVILNTLPVLP